MCRAKTQIGLGICLVWTESSLSTQWVAKDPSFLHADNEDSRQTGRMPKLIWVFAGRSCYFAGFVVRRLICNFVSGQNYCETMQTPLPDVEQYEPRHDKTNKVSARRAKIQISLGIRPVWSESSLYAWRNLWSLATHWAHNEDSDQAYVRLRWRTLILLALSCGSISLSRTCSFVVCSFCNCRHK